jgi:hypothetical protein
MRFKSIMFILISILFTNVMAQDFSVGLKVGTLGLGVQVGKSFGESACVCLGAQYLSLELEDGGTVDYNYKAVPQLSSLTLGMNFYPFKNAFHISSGILFNYNTAMIEMIPAKTYTIGGDVYSPDKLGELNADVKFNRVAPYLGIGFSNLVKKNSMFGVLLDIGIVYQGSPSVDLAADGLLEPSADVDQEEQLEENLEWLKLYPVISLGLNYNF